MKIIILGREELEELSQNPFPQNTGIISVVDYGAESIKLQHAPDYLLQLSFNNVDSISFDWETGKEPNEIERITLERKYHMLTDPQAKQIVDFYLSIENQISTLICQCECGISRSSAIASAILEYRNKQGIKIFADERYEPNKNVFRKVYKYLIESGYNCLFNPIKYTNNKD